MLTALYRLALVSARKRGALDRRGAVGSHRSKRRCSGECVARPMGIHKCALASVALNVMDRGGRRGLVKRPTGLEARSEHHESKKSRDRTSHRDAGGQGRALRFAASARRGSLPRVSRRPRRLSALESASCRLVSRSTSKERVRRGFFPRPEPIPFGRTRCAGFRQPREPQCDRTDAELDKALCLAERRRGNQARRTLPEEQSGL